TWPPATSCDGVSWSISGVFVLVSQSPAGVRAGDGATGAAARRGCVALDVAAQAKATPIVNESASNTLRATSRRSRVTWRSDMSTTVIGREEGDRQYESHCSVNRRTVKPRLRGDTSLLHDSVSRK